MRRLLLLALFLLPGCWVGGDFYSARDMRATIPAGDYSASGDSIDPGVLRISVRGDNSVRLVPVGEDGTEDHGDAFTIGFASIDDEMRLFAAWVIANEGGAPDSSQRQYLLLRRNGDGSYSLLVPTCSGEGEIAARNARARIAAQENTRICEFDDRASLETALRAVAPHLGDGMRLAPAARR